MFPAGRLRSPTLAFPLSYSIAATEFGINPADLLRGPRHHLHATWRFALREQSGRQVELRHNLRPRRRAKQMAGDVIACF